MVRKHITFDPWWPVEMYARRGDLLLVYAAFDQAVRRTFGVLCGLNLLYYPGLKWLDHTVEQMPIRPPDLAARMRQAFRGEPAAGGEQMRQLVEEILSLVEAHMPEVDVGEARDNFRYRRPVLDEAPEGWN